MQINSDYSSHREQFESALPDSNRIKTLEEELVLAFEKYLKFREVAFICFGDLNAEELAIALSLHPIIVKPILTCVNVAGRAIKRDLGINIDTYGDILSLEQASLLAGFIKPILPDQIAIPALMELDRFFWTDKEMRSQKGNWESSIREKINEIVKANFKKRKFTYSGERYELDAAYPSDGDKIIIGIDVKRIEAQQDIHKRTDEIINKAIKYKNEYPYGMFIAVIYFPFPSQHINLQNRLRHESISHIFFAGESPSSIQNCVEIMAGILQPLIIDN